VDEYAVGSLALTAVARHRVPVVEMGILSDIERYSAARVEANSEIAAGIDLLDGAQFTVSDTLLSIRRSELHAVAFAELLLLFPVQRHALQTARIVADALAVCPFNCDEILFLLNALHTGILTWCNAQGLAAFCVADDIARFLLGSPLTVCF